MAVAFLFSVALFCAVPHRALAFSSPFLCHVDLVVKADSSTALFGKAKRGRLASSIDFSDATSSSKKNKKKKLGSSKTARGKAIPKSKNQADESISPLLAEWAAKSPSSTSSDSTAASDSANVLSSAVTAEKSSVSTPLVNPNAFETFENVEKTSKRKRQRSTKKASTRQMAQATRDETAEKLVDEIRLELESEAKQRNIDDILEPIRQLIELPAATEQFRTITAGAKRNDYCLAWVGSDDAVSHMGTGLHKVPLARLQEVFLSLPGRNTVQLQEVIRVLGPFPNVKNVLQGSSVTTKSSSGGINDDGSLQALDWTILWESMLDGTGKELLAGKAEDSRKISVHVYFCTEEVLIAVVPPNLDDPSERRKDPFEEAGKHILLFFKEDDLNLKLEKYRVAK